MKSNESGELNQVSETHGANDAVKKVTVKVEVNGSEDFLSDGDDEGPEVHGNNDLEVFRNISRVLVYLTACQWSVA